jgi:hypothetical protein
MTTCRRCIVRLLALVALLAAPVAAIAFAASRPAASGAADAQLAVSPPSTSSASRDMPR